MADVWELLGAGAGWVIGMREEGGRERGREGTVYIRRYSHFIHKDSKESRRMDQINRMMTSNNVERN